MDVENRMTAELSLRLPSLHSPGRRGCSERLGPIRAVPYRKPSFVPTRTPDNAATLADSQMQKRTGPRMAGRQRFLGLSQRATRCRSGSTFGSDDLSIAAFPFSCRAAHCRATAVHRVPHRGLCCPAPGGTDKGGGTRGSPSSRRLCGLSAVVRTLSSLLLRG